MTDKAVLFKVALLVVGIGAFAWICNSEGTATGYIHNRRK